MLQHRRLGGIGQQRRQDPPAPVVVLACQIHHRLAFHVGLSGEDEDFDRGRRDRAETQNEEEKNGRKFHERGAG